MTEDTQTPPQPEDSNQPPPLDPAFFTCVNEYLQLTNRQSKEQGLKRISMASLYAASRFNAHVYLGSVVDAAADRQRFLDYMTRMYRRMLNEHIDALGVERGRNVGESELAAEYAAAGYTLPGRPIPASEATKTADPVPPAAPAAE